MRGVLTIIVLLVAAPFAFIFALQKGWLEGYVNADDIPAEPFIRAELANNTNGADLSRRIDNALDEDRFDDAVMYRDIADYMNMPLDPDTQARLASEESLPATLLRSTGGFFSGFVTGEGEDTASMAGAITSDLTVVGDVRDIGSEGGKMIRGEDYSQFILGLSVVGLAATTATVATGGGGLPARIGVSILKVAKKAGHITEAFAKNIARLLREAVNFDKLRDVLRSTDLANTSATRRAVTEYADTISFARLTPALEDVATLSKTAGPAETVRLMKYADNTDDLARLSKMSGKMGTKTRGIIELTGKTSLRAFKTVANLVLLAFHWIWEIGAAIGAMFLGGVVRSVRKRRRNRRIFAA